MSSDPATSTKVERVAPNGLSATTSSGQHAPADAAAAWLVGLLQAGDSFYPTGSYAHSFGLEGLVQEGAVRDRASLREFILLSVLPSLRQAELPLAAHAWRAIGETDWEKLRRLAVLGSALKSAQEARMSADNIGRQRTELIATLRGNAMAQEYLRRAAEAGWPFSPSLAAALEGRALGAPLPAVLGGVYYSTVAATVSAAMKLLRLGQNAGQSLLTEAVIAAPPIISAAQEISETEIGWFNPWLDIAATRHATADSRMFIS